MNGYGKDPVVEGVEQRELSVGPYVIDSDNLVNHDKVRVIAMPTKAVRLKAGTRWMGQRVEFLTCLYGKEYYWMRDGDNVVYLAKVGKDGLPDLS